MPTDKYAQDIDALRADLKAMQIDMTTLTKRLTGDMRNGAQRVAADINDAGAEGIARAKHAGQQGAEAVTDTVRENPFGSLAAAAGIGFVLGSLMRRN